MCHAGKKDSGESVEGEAGLRALECARRDCDRLCLRRTRGVDWESAWVVWCLCGAGAGLGSGSSANRVNLEFPNGLDASRVGERGLGVAKRLYTGTLFTALEYRRHGAHLVFEIVDDALQGPTGARSTGVGAVGGDERRLEWFPRRLGDAGEAVGDGGDGGGGIVLDEGTGLWGGGRGLAEDGGGGEEEGGDDDAVVAEGGHFAESRWRLRSYMLKTTSRSMTTAFQFGTRPNQSLVCARNRLFLYLPYMPVVIS